MPKVTKLADIIKNDVIPFAENANFKIESWEDFLTELKAHLQCAVTNSAYYGDMVEIHGAQAALFNLTTTQVHISDVVKWLNGNDASSYIFKYCITKNFPKYLAFYPKKDEVFEDITKMFLPSTQHSMSVCIDKKDLKKKVSENLLKTIKFYLRVAGIDVTMNEIRKKMMNGYSTTSSGLITKKTTKDTVIKCIDTFKNLKHWTVYNGYAGTGKTYQAVHSIKPTENILCISLSNTVTLQLKQRLLANNIPPENITVCPYAGLHKVEFDTFDVIVIDEISQSGINEYRSFLEIFKKAPDARYIFMGDVNQIKSFISGGSLLNTLVEEFKGTKHIVNLTKIQRSSNVQLNQALLNFINTGDVKPFVVSNQTKITDYDIIVTGAKINVARLNNEYVAQKFGQKSHLTQISSNSIKFDVMDYDTDTNDMLYRAMCKGNVIELIGKGKTLNKVKICTNEPWTAQMVNKKIIATSKIDGRQLEVPAQCFKGGQFFAPGYAITVNRAQGLEWNKVLVVANMLKSNGTRDRNLYETYESMYVALSRAKLVSHLMINDNLGSKMKRYIRANNYAEVQ